MMEIIQQGDFSVASIVCAIETGVSDTSYLYLFNTLFSIVIGGLTKHP